jgi:DNA repair protein RecN (Recombination protein N)
LDHLITEIKELSRDFENTGDKSNPNPERLMHLEERFGKLQNLLKKHRVLNSAELLCREEELLNVESTTSNLEFNIESIEKEIQQHRVIQEQQIAELRERRNAVIEDFQNRLTQDLISLEMPHVHLRLTLKNTEATLTGADHLVFLFSANRGVELQELHKCASGGELSRVNFCIRNLIAEKKSLPSLIYDEADTGVSGQVASRIGTLLRLQGKHQQILAITHLPQVAAAGENQLYVFKSHLENFTETQTKYLSEEERQQEIAVMLSGNNPSGSALAAALDLISAYNR